MARRKSINLGGICVLVVLGVIATVLNSAFVGIVSLGNIMTEQFGTTSDRVKFVVGLTIVLTPLIALQVSISRYRARMAARSFDRNSHEWLMPSREKMMHYQSGVLSGKTHPPQTSLNFVGQLDSPERKTQSGHFTREQDLERAIVDNWNRLDFGVPLEFVRKQFVCDDIGRIDILARRRDTRDYLVLELKKEKSDDADFGQLARYMGWVQEHLAGPEGVEVEGIIIGHDFSRKLCAASKSNSRVRLLQYIIDDGSPTLRNHLDFEVLVIPCLRDNREPCCGHKNRPDARYCALCGKQLIPVHDENQTVLPSGLMVDATKPCASTTTCGRADTCVAIEASINRSALDIVLTEMSQLNGGSGLSKRLASDLQRSNYRWVRQSTIRRLSKWTHPRRRAEREQSMRPIAQRASLLLFGCVVSRELLD